MPTLPPEAAYRPDGTLVLRFPYDAYLVSQLKAMIPAHARTWDADHKWWTVAGVYRDTAIHLLLETFPSARIGDPPQPFASTSPAGCACAQQPACGALFIRPDAPGEVIDAAYKALARLNHPDRGGDTADMQRINQAHDALLQERGKA